MKTRDSLLVAPLLITAALLAQSPAPAALDNVSPHAVPAGRVAGPLLRALDTDRDGTLSQREIQLAPIALTAFDLDEDGFLLRDEISPSSLAHGRRAVFRLTSLPGRPPADAAVLIALDANHDGVVQPIEVANAASSLRRLDADADGEITRDELRAAVSPRSAHPGT